MDARHYARMLRWARRHSRRSGEEHDLLQTALLAAVEAGRADMTQSANRRWLAGVLRRRALHEARSAVRRRRRESDYLAQATTVSTGGERPAEFLQSLPSGLRVAALLALTGHTKPEIGWLLNVSDVALRRRFSDIRQRWRTTRDLTAPDDPGPIGDLAFGLLRQGMLKAVRASGPALGAHDPDGHLFLIGSQTRTARQRPRSNPSTGEKHVR